MSCTRCPFCRENTHIFMHRGCGGTKPGMCVSISSRPSGCGLTSATGAEARSAEYGTRCFRIVRTDGFGEDFSYRHCTNGSRAG